MMRDAEGKAREENSVVAAQIANGGQRDAFIALGHTVLFTASIAFMGDVRPAAQVEWIGLLFAAWTSSIIGLFALTLSFQVADRAADERLVHMHDDHANDRHRALDVCNSIALWTFPISMLGTAAFAAKNLWSVA